MVSMMGMQRQPGKQCSSTDPCEGHQGKNEVLDSGSHNNSGSHDRCALDIRAEGGRHGAQVHRHERRRVLDQRLAAHLRGRPPVVRVAAWPNMQCMPQAWNSGGPRCGIVKTSYFTKSLVENMFHSLKNVIPHNAGCKVAAAEYASTLYGNHRLIGLQAVRACW